MYNVDSSICGTAQKQEWEESKKLSKVRSLVSLYMTPNYIMPLTRVKGFFVLLRELRLLRLRYAPVTLAASARFYERMFKIRSKRHA